MNVGGDVKQLAAGQGHTCALLTTGAVRCWGWGYRGQVGYGNSANIGDDEYPADAGDIELGGTATQIAAGNDHTCAILEGGSLRCWGYNQWGQLGYGHTQTIGDDEVPAAVGDVDVGGEVASVALGDRHTCALLTTGTVRCWGAGGEGQLGYGNTNSIGDDETPASVGTVAVGATTIALACGGANTCVVLEDGSALCWGENLNGELGQAIEDRNEVIGDDETPEFLDPIVLGDTAKSISMGRDFACALTTSAQLRCWGYAGDGALGYGNKNQIGDDEYPSDAGPVPLVAW